MRIIFNNRNENIFLCIIDITWLEYKQNFKCSLKQGNLCSYNFPDSLNPKARKNLSSEFPVSLYPINLPQVIIELSALNKYLINE